MELVEVPSLRLVRNMSLLVSSLFLPLFIALTFHWHTQQPPVSFYVDALRPDTSYRILLFSVNPKGRSEPVIIDGIHFKGPAKFAGATNKMDLQWSPFVAALAVIASLLFVCSSCVLVALYRRGSRK